jgi:hypothetical protein
VPSNSERVQLKINVTEEEKTWAEELARDAGKTVTDLLRDHIRSTHAEKVRKEKHMQKTDIVKLSDEEVWLYQRIRKGGPLGEALSIESIDYAARVQFGDEILFSLGPMLTRLREGGFIRRVGPSGRDYEAGPKKAPRS